VTTETEFIDSIDCRFPYMDTKAAFTLIERACLISPNAAFTIIHELARPPRGVSVPAAQLRQLLSRLELSFDHPLKDVVVQLARAMIDGQLISESQALDVMQQISPFRNEFAALAIAYFALGDHSDAIEKLYNETVERWSSDLT